MNDRDALTQMRDDWNSRAKEDAGYYVAFGRRHSDDEAFFATAKEVVNRVEWELTRVPPAQRAQWRALEVGCGPGRLMLSLKHLFAEIHGVDVSDEMITLAREKLQNVSNVYVYATNGSDLDPFASDSFEFVYSYAVFQHIPSQAIVFDYLKAIRRVMRMHGLALLQFNGLAHRRSGVDTWDGVRFSAAELLEFARRHDFQVLALEGAGTQYMWTTWCKQPEHWHDAQDKRGETAMVNIRRITNANSSEPVAPCRGRFASISLWVEALPAEADLLSLQVTIGGAPGFVCYIGPPDRAGLQQVNVLLPELEATGLLPVDMYWLRRRVSTPMTLRVIPPGPSVPRVRAVTDGVNLSAANRTETRSVKLTLEEIVRPEDLEVFVDDFRVHGLEYFCTDPRAQRYEVNCMLPDEIGPGTHHIIVKLGKRKLGPIPLEVLPAD